MIRLPEAQPLRERPELAVKLLETVESVTELTEPEEPGEPDELQPIAIEPTAIAPAEIVAGERPLDWYAEMSEVVSEISLAPSEPAVFNVAQMEKRRRAAEKFAPIPSHEPVPIWDNVVKDMTGRSVLVHGDCERVIDDPNVGSRDAFEVFGQYIVMCKSHKEKPKVLAWANEIKSRREGPSRYGRRLAE